jgi:integrase
MTKLSYEDKLKLAKGISEFKGNFRLQFKLPDIKSAVRRSLGIMACEENLETAKETLSAIKRDIANGSYRIDPVAFWVKHFPNSVKVEEVKIYNLETIFDIYEAEHFDDLSESLQSKFKSCKTWTTKHGLMKINIKDLSSKQLNKIRKVSAKKLAVSSVVEYSRTLKRIIDIGIEDEIIEYNPFTNVNALTPDDNIKQTIQPFTKTELATLLQTIHLPQVKVMVELLAWTGLRPGEMKALAWEDVHINEENLTGYVNINYSITRKGNLKMPKTGASVRKVELFPDTIKLLCKQKEFTFNKPTLSEAVHLQHGKIVIVNRRRVFLSRDNQPYKRPELTSVPKQWANWLIESNISHRPSYQLRHTYASRMLKSGGNHVWLAKQMGHTDWGMIRIIYGNWIDEGNEEITKILSNLQGGK